MLEEIFKEYDNHPPFDIPKTKEEAMELSKELGELSEDVDKNIERMKEIAHVLVTYYMQGKTVESAEKKSVENDQKNIV